MAKRFRARDKLTQKMGRGGLVEKNLATGEVKQISQRGQAFELKKALPHEMAVKEGPQKISGKRRQVVQASQNARIEKTEQPLDQYVDDFARIDGATQYDDRWRDEPSEMDAAPQPTRLERRSFDSNPQEAKRKKRNKATSRKFHDSGDVDTTVNSTASIDTPATERSTERKYAGSDEKRIVAKSDWPVTESSRRTSRVHESAGRLRLEDDRQDAVKPRRKNQRSTEYSQRFSPDREEAPADAIGSADGVDSSDLPRDDAPFAPVHEDTETIVPDVEGRASDGIAGDAPQSKPSKLQFSADEKPPKAVVPPNEAASASVDKKYVRAQKKAEHATGKLEQAEANIPTKKRLRMEKQSDGDSGEIKRKLFFEESPKSMAEHVKGSLATRPVKFGADRVVNFAHRKIRQAENENVGVEAAHKGEEIVERAVRKGYRAAKTSPYRKLSKWQRKSAKAQRRAAYQTLLSENPSLRSNPLSRFVQKQRIKREYAQALRNARKAERSVRNAAYAGTRLLSRAVYAIRRNPKIIVMIGAFLALLIIISSVVSSCSTLSSGLLSAISASTYAASDSDIDDAELAYTSWEADLLLQIENAELTYPGYDSYYYEIDDVGHDPYELMAYLTAVYGNFQFASIEADLRAIFDEQYTLTFTPSVETITVTDPVTGQVTQQQGNILKVKLVSKSLTDVLASKMTTEQRQIYDLLMETKGNRQYLINPFDFNWLPYVTTYYGYRIHPDTGLKDFHKGIDITVAAGTTILAGHDGTVSSAAYDAEYGNVVVLDDGAGFVSKYTHCQTMLVSAGQTVEKGDPIATVGSTGNATEAHLHLELIKDGRHLNPLFFGQTGDTGNNSPVIPDYPGEAMTDASYAALMAEAQKHLGKPYVFGSSGPDTFDCSGFICWVLDKSGVYPTGRTNAQGIYNKCTPVSKENAKPGDLIFFQGTYSTSNTVTHVGIYIGNNQMIHCGNPVQYTSITTSYWTEHFYAFGRIG